VEKNKLEGKKVKREDEEGEEEGVEDQNGSFACLNVFKIQKTVENFTETRDRGKCVKYNTTKL
jgi:hypothetical protein